MLPLFAPSFDRTWHLILSELAKTLPNLGCGNNVSFQAGIQDSVIKGGTVRFNIDHFMFIYHPAQTKKTGKTISGGND
jgi:hypothetical protein